MGRRKISLKSAEKRLQRYITNPLRLLSREKEDQRSVARDDDKNYKRWLHYFLRPL